MPLLEENLLSDSMIALSISLSSVLSVKKYGRFEPESTSIKKNKLKNMGVLNRNQLQLKKIIQVLSS